MAKKDIVHFIKTIVADHQALWQARMPDMRSYKRAYETRFFEGSDYPKDQIRVETSDGYAYIEGYIASLFSKAPSVVVGEDIKPVGDSTVVQALSNRFLFDQHSIIEEGSRLSLIYTNSFFKLVPRPSSSALDSVTLQAIAPWHIILDLNASSWKTQRYIGHIYYISLVEADEKYGAKKWKPIEKEHYFVNDKGLKDRNVELPDEYKYIFIAEIYDLVNDKLYFWSPCWNEGKELLDNVEIPLRSYDEEPLVPIVPLYYVYKADEPLEGMSSIGRIYDQLMEKNIMRSFWANAIRRDSRQYIYKSGAIDEEDLAKITAGIDGLMIPVGDKDGNDINLGSLIYEVPNTPINHNHQNYLAMVEQDLSRGSVLAPFTRGQATGNTATETAALAQYSASEIGRMARVRDTAIEQIAYIYVRMVSLFITEENIKDVILIDKKPEILNPKKLEGKFRFEALDQGNTPLASETKKQNMVQLAPVLMQLGVPKEDILKEIVRLYELPSSFTNVPKELPPTPQLKAPPVSTQTDMVAPPISPETITG